MYYKQKHTECTAQPWPFEPTICVTSTPPSERARRLHARIYRVVGLTPNDLCVVPKSPTRLYLPLPYSNQHPDRRTFLFRLCTPLHFPPRNVRYKPTRHMSMSASTHGIAVSHDEGVNGEGEATGQESAQGGEGAGSQDAGIAGRLDETVLKGCTTTTLFAVTNAECLTINF